MYEIYDKKAMVIYNLVSKEKFENTITMLKNKYGKIDVVYSSNYIATIE